jgi:methyltransferase-like protein/ubiquinone/menaquinone biosynthesis C-methylase UbiE
VSRLIESYERMPYPSGSHHLSHPQHVAAMAIVYGLDPPPPERCRVLELGCSDGGNLIAAAASLPESQFVGIDFSPRQIELGRAFLGDMQMRNVELRVQSIMDVDASIGTFDYIIAHGVLSWVAEDVREKIFEICRKQLAPDGIAYISYNAYPGWRQREMVRDMALYHTRNESDPAVAAQRAIELVRFAADVSGSQMDAHSIALRVAREQIDEHAGDPTYVLHDFLEETNRPLYFHEFMARAEEHGLQYVAESEPGITEVETLSPAVGAKLREYAKNRVELEQYVDFVTNRLFRRSLLCHAGSKVERTVTPQRLRRLHMTTIAKPVGDNPDLREGVTEAFRNERGAVFSTTHPLAKAGLVSLAAAWPRTMTFDEMLNDVRKRLRVTASIGDADLTDLVGSLHASGVVELLAAPVICTNTVSNKPMASELVRHQASRGALVTNQRRRVVKMDDPTALFILTKLDGTRDHAALVRLLDGEAQAGRLSLSMDGNAVSPERRPLVIQAVLEHALRKMAEYALLVS